MRKGEPSNLRGGRKRQKAEKEQNRGGWAGNIGSKARFHLVPKKDLPGSVITQNRGRRGPITIEKTEKCNYDEREEKKTNSAGGARKD